MQVAFVINKVRRLLKSCGKWYEFKHLGTNSFNEPDPSSSYTVQLFGVLHETFVRPVFTVTEDSQTRSLPQVNILCLYKDFLESGVAVGDELSIGDKLYIVQSAVDIQKMNAVIDIVLEAIDNGRIQA